MATRRCGHRGVQRDGGEVRRQWDKYPKKVSVILHRLCAQRNENIQTRRVFGFTHTHYVFVTSQTITASASFVT